MEEAGERIAVVSNTRLVGRSSSDAALSLITYILQPTTHLNTSFDCRRIYWLLILFNAT
jgi:hypothetical protein